MLTHLSPAWMTAMAEAIAEDEVLQSLGASVDLAVTVWVGDVSYHLITGRDGVAFGPGPAPRATLTVRQSAATAEQVLAGELNPQRAFLDGRIRVDGGADQLVAARPLMEALARATGRLRPAVPDA